ncbi:MAG: hypothetical protein SFV54_01710 [Bryobacteraceae bacterium]|nr:hypothetical protein [Bryobacteraceae bacterium]
MLPNFLLPETTAREDGSGPVLELGESAGKLLVLTLGITRIIEQESLDLSIWGSADGVEWGSRALVAFPQKFYCGTYTMLLDLTDRPEVRHIRVQWKMNRWGRGDSKPLFGFYVFGQVSADDRVMAVAG